MAITHAHASPLRDAPQWHLRPHHICTEDRDKNMFAVTNTRCAAAPGTTAASTLASKRGIVSAPLRVTPTRRTSAVNLKTRAAGTIEKVTKDELEKVMQVR